MTRNQLILVVFILGYDFVVTKSLGEEDRDCKLLSQESDKEKCCEFRSFLTDTSETKDTSSKLANCIKSLKQNMSLPNSGDYFKECVAECLFNALGFLTARMELDESIMNTKAKEIFGKDEKWREVAIIATKECISSATKQVKNDSFCKSSSLQFSTCFARELFLNCPADQWNDSEKCVDEKMKLEKCPNMVPGAILKYSLN